MDSGNKSPAGLAAVRGLVIQRRGVPICYGSGYPSALPSRSWIGELWLRL